MDKLYKIYRDLYQAYGPQGWWPIVGHVGTNPTKTGSVHGYHVADYSFPHNKNEQFEICLGAILTQNTAWPSVEKSLLNLSKAGNLSPELIISMSDEKLKEMIRPSGYYNQKTRYIKNFAVFYQNLNNKMPTRKELLSQLGVGPETADSILLYAFGQPEFVVDAYTKRIFSALGLFKEAAKYEDVKMIFEESLRKNVSKKDLLMVYQEYHALIVEHAKRCYSKKPFGRDCWLKKRYEFKW